MKDEKLTTGEWTTEQARLAERVFIGFVRMGAKLSEDGKKEYADTQAELATLHTIFMQNVLKDKEEWENDDRQHNGIGRSCDYTWS